MKHLIQNNEIIRSEGLIPETFEYDKNTYFGYNLLSAEELYAHGWRDEAVPGYDPVLEYLGKAYFDPILDAVTYPVKQRNDLPTLEDAKIRKVKEIKRAAKELLNDTDYYAIRKAETGKAIPTDVIAERQAIRAKSDELEISVGALISVRDVLIFEVSF